MTTVKLELFSSITMHFFVQKDMTGSASHTTYSHIQSLKQCLNEC